MCHYYVLQASNTEQSTTLTVQGSGFGTDASMLNVMVGPQACQVVGVPTDIEFTCDVEHLPTGTHDLKVLVTGKGL